MLFHYEKTVTRTVRAATELCDRSPAWLAIGLVASLSDWLGPAEIDCGPGVRVGYPMADVPVMEYAETCGPMLARIAQQWPVQSFGIADNGELVGLTFTPAGRDIAVQAQNVSGVWHDHLNGLYLDLSLPDEQASRSLAGLLRAAACGAPVAVLDWDCADFLRAQQVDAVDPTLSFCYVCLEDTADPMLLLESLTLAHKRTLWRLFLEKQAYPPEFAWLRDALGRGLPSGWTAWTLALYQTMDALGFRLRCSGGVFELVDGTGQRLYFGADQASAAAQVLMKILFPLNR